jgi:hypothetical protein
MNITKIKNTVGKSPYYDKILRDLINSVDVSTIKKNLPDFVSIIRILSTKKELNSIQATNLFELSISLNYFNSDALDQAENVLKSRKNYFIKLEALDFLLTFIKKIKKEKFISLNSYIIATSQNSLLIFQANLNLSYYNRNHLTEIINIIQKEPYPSLFYRGINSIQNSDLIVKIPTSWLDDLSKIMMKKNYNEDVKSELRKRIRYLKRRMVI